MGARNFGGAVRFVLGGSGHIAGIVNPPAANKYGYWTNDATDGNLPESPDDFLAGATQNAGSWWTHLARVGHQPAGRFGQGLRPASRKRAT